MGNDPQEKIDTAKKVLQDTTKGKYVKMYIGVAVVAIIALNAMWNAMERRIDSLRSNIEAVGARADETVRLSANADFSALRAEFEAIRAAIKTEADSTQRAGETFRAAIRTDADSLQKAGEAFNAKLNAVIRAEEARLEALTREVENRRAYIGALKSLLSN